MYRKTIAFLALGGLLVLALWPAFHSPAQPMDEGMLLVYPERLLKGSIPYRDFESITGPGNILILAAAYHSFGVNIFVERAVGFSYRLLLVLSIFAITQRWNTAIAAACAFSAAVLVTSSDLWSNTWFAGISFAVCAVAWLGRVNSFKRCLGGGIFAGLALLSRCDLGPGFIVALLPLFLLMNRRGKAAFLAGLSIALSPLLWFLVAAGPAALIHNLFLYPVFGLNPGRHLPLAAAPTDLKCVFALHVGASVINLAAAIVSLRYDSKAESPRVLLAAAILGAAFMHYALQRFDSGHAINAAILSLSLLPLSIFVLLSRMRIPLPSWSFVAAAIAIPLLATQLLLPRFTRYFYRGLRVSLGVSPVREASKPGEELEPGDKGLFITHNHRSFSFGFEYAANDAEKLFTELERASTPGQRLFVGPADLRLTNYCDTYIYYMEPQLTPATYHLEMNPGSANAPDSRLPSDLASADWVVLNRRWDFLTENNRSVQFGSDEPLRVLRRDFDLWWQSGPYLLLRNKRISNAVILPPPG